MNCRLPRSGEAFLTVTPFGQTWFCDRDAVLDKNLSLIDVHPRLEDDVDRNPSVSRRLRGNIEHVVNAVDLLLDGRPHSRRYDCGGSARVIRDR